MQFGRLLITLIIAVPVLPHYTIVDRHFILDHQS